MPPSTTTMQGVILTGHGGPEMLEWRDDLPIPEPGPHEVLIKTSAAGVNNTDINTRVGWYSKGDGDAEDAAWGGNALEFPRVQGIDVCGQIVELGADINASRIGERVLVEPCLRYANGDQLKTPWFVGSECDGGFAQYMRVDARHAYPIDSLLSDIELASFPCSYSTAENMLTRASVTEKDRVLVTGASGGVGSAAVQLAKARGAHVIAVTSASKADQLHAIGADEIVRRDENYVAVLGNNSVDVVIDLVAGPQWPTLLEVLVPQGRYAVSGAIAGPIVELDVRTLYLKDLVLMGCTVLEPFVFANLIKRIEQEEIKPLVAKTFPLREIGAAQTLFDAKQHVGKIVLDVENS
ncbi:MAG: alcohol dehydrogenase family protein [Hyphomicrobiales bacterium]